MENNEAYKRCIKDCREQMMRTLEEIRTEYEQKLKDKDELLEWKDSWIQAEFSKLKDERIQMHNSMTNFLGECVQEIELQRVAMEKNIEVERIQMQKSMTDFFSHVLENAEFEKAEIIKNWKVEKAQIIESWEVQKAQIIESCANSTELMKESCKTCLVKSLRMQIAALVSELTSHTEECE